MAVLTNRVVIVTGSSRGLGLAIARATAVEGAAVVLSSRSAASIERAVAELRAEGLRAAGWTCDVSDLSQVEALAAHAIETFGGFDVWVNNAGLSGPYGPTAHVPPQDFLKVIQTNIVGTYHGSLVALRHFYPRNAGKLINILGRGDTGAVAYQNAYTASKTWVRSFTKALAQEYRDTGLGIYAYNPGLMVTDFLTDLRAIAGYEQRLEPLRTVTRMWGNPPDVPAQKVVWLASTATDGKTGLEVRELGPLQLAGGALREGLRRLLRRPTASMEMHVETVQPAMSFHSANGSSSASAVQQPLAEPQEGKA